MDNLEKCLQEIQEILDKYNEQTRMTYEADEVYPLSEMASIISATRKTMKINQEELATLATVALGSVKKLENHDMSVTLTVLQKILDVVGFELCLKKK
jgi:DNA-binding XRE family transcriptional regulator